MSSLSDWSKIIEEQGNERRARAVLFQSSLTKIGALSLKALSIDDLLEERKSIINQGNNGAFSFEELYVVVSRIHELTEAINHLCKEAPDETT